VRRSRQLADHSAAALARARAEQHQAEKEAATLRRALDAIPQGIVVADHEGSVLFRNRSAATLADPRQQDSLVAQTVDDLLRQAVDKGAAAVTLELHGPPARILHISARSGVVVIDDVTQQRQLDAIRRDFAANVSHELRTPIGAMGLLVDSLADEPDREVAGRLIKRLSQEADRVTLLIEHLLDLSRTEAEAEAAHEQTAVALADVLAEAAERGAALADHLGVRLDVTWADETAVVTGSRRQLVSALVNLIENGLRYSAPGSAVTVTTEAVAFGVTVVVSDTGIGIPGRDLDRIFERFYRVDRARSRETGGSGLGLAIVRHVAQNHGGEISVESREGEGSTFRLTLPVRSRS
jgi:two-component system sensor histidine kinase SenX3